MIDTEALFLGWTEANGADTALGSEHLSVFGLRDTKLTPDSG